MAIPRLTGTTVSVAGSLIRTPVGGLASVELAKLIIEKPLDSLDLEAEGQPPMFVPTPYRPAK